MKLLATGGKIFTGRLGQAVLNAAIGFVLADRLAPEGLGYYSLTIAVILLVAAVLNGGIGLAAVPALRRAAVTLGRMLKAQATWISVTAGLILVAILLGTRSGLADLATSRLGWNGLTTVAGGVAIISVLTFEILYYDLLAVGRLVVGPVVNCGRAALHLLLLLAMLLFTNLDLTAAVIAFAVAQLAAASCVVTLIERHRQGDETATDPAGTSNRAVPIVPLIGKTIRRGWHGQISAVASLLNLRLNLALLSTFCDATSVGIYAFAAMVGELLWHLPGALSPVLVYSSAAPDDVPQSDALAARAVRVALIVTLVVAVPLALAIGPVLRILFDGQYVASATPLRCLLPGIVAFAPGAVLAGDFIGRGRPIWNAQASILTVTLSLGGGLFLIPRFEVLGAAVAASLAYGFGAAFMVARFRSVTGFSFREILVPTWRDFH
ncbi:MAG: polysaccharide biosynthesis C-terminal domain-containing protein [bacterium]